MGDEREPLLAAVPRLGDTLTYPRVAAASFPGDNPAIATSLAPNRQRQMDTDRSFSQGRRVLVEIRYNGQTVDKKSCTFKTTQSPSGPGTAAITCN